MSEKDTNKVSVGTFARNFYSPGSASIGVSFYNSNLSLRFYRYMGKNNGSDYYDLPNGITTTLNYENASYLHQVATFILTDTYNEEEIRAVIQCNKADLILECRPDQDNQRTAYLTIEKNNQSISFKFKTHSVQIKEHGHIFTKVVQSGLGAFAKTLEGYLTGIGADLHLGKLPDNFENSQYENQQVSDTTTVNNEYQ
jgi:hypothetical protein